MEESSYEERNNNKSTAAPSITWQLCSKNYFQMAHVDSYFEKYNKNVWEWFFKQKFSNLALACRLPDSQRYHRPDGRRTERKSVWLGTKRGDMNQIDFTMMSVIIMHSVTLSSSCNNAWYCLFSPSIYYLLCLWPHPSQWCPSRCFPAAVKGKTLAATSLMEAWPQLENALKFRPIKSSLSHCDLVSIHHFTEL